MLKNKQQPLIWQPQKQQPQIKNRKKVKRKIVSRKKNAAKISNRKYNSRKKNAAKIAAANIATAKTETAKMRPQTMHRPETRVNAVSKLHHSDLFQQRIKEVNSLIGAAYFCFDYEQMAIAHNCQPCCSFFYFLLNPIDRVFCFSSFSKVKKIFALLFFMKLLYN